MTRNPEFQRQLWLNWRPSLLVWSLGLSALILALPLALSAPGDRAVSLSMTALIGLWAAVAFYGSMLAGRSLREEASQNTWDWQRLSALSPWQMVWGKLLGATVAAWLYALWFATALLFVSATWPRLNNLSGLALQSVALAVLWGLGLQAWAMNSVLVAWGQRATPANRRQTELLPALPLLLLLPTLMHSYGKISDGGHSPLLWWGMNIGYKGAAYLFGALLLALGLLALWRLLCARLNVRTLPWAWPLGLVACGFFAAGLRNIGLADFWDITCWIALLGTALIALLHMDGHLRDWRQVQWSASRGRWREALQALPLWPVSWMLALATCVIFLLWPGHRNPDFSPLLACLHLLRDCLILTGLALLAGRLRSPLGVFCIVWAIINIALPLLADGVAGRAGAAVVQPAVMLMFHDADASAIHNVTAWISLGVQLLLAAGWTAWVFHGRVLGFARENDPENDS